MTNVVQSFVEVEFTGAGSKPALRIRRIGLVARDYRQTFPNGYRDFTYVLPAVLKHLDNEGCDTVLFSLYSVIPRKDHDLRRVFKELSNIKAVLLEEFQDGKSRDPVRYVIYHRTGSGWNEYAVKQAFGSVTGIKREKIAAFVTHEVPWRTLGDCCVLLCGETNAVKYAKSDKKVHDTFGLRQAISPEVKVILNPIHDRMVRFEMTLKRKFLSKNGRWIVSVWNKGKQDRNGRTRDGNGPAWTVFHDGEEIEVTRIPNDFGVELGILDIDSA